MRTVPIDVKHLRTYETARLDAGHIVLHSHVVELGFEMTDTAMDALADLQKYLRGRAKKSSSAATFEIDLLEFDARERDRTPAEADGAGPSTRGINADTEGTVND